MSAPINLILCLFGFTVRYLTFYSSWSLWLRGRVEVSTPLNSWKRMTEGIFLYDNGIDPYSGDAFHEQPLFLVGFHFLHKNFREWIPIIFMIVDVLTAVALSSAAVHFGRYLNIYIVQSLVLHQDIFYCNFPTLDALNSKMLLQRQKLEEHTYAAGTETLLLNERQLRRAVVCTLVIYLFNPYTVASCAGLTTTVFSNFFLAMAFLWTCKGRRVGACLFLSLADYQLFYAKMLIVPCAMMITQVEQGMRLPRSYGSSRALSSIAKTVILFLGVLAALFYCSHAMMGSWNFVRSTYGFVFYVPDLTPNQGLFWYFFTEMFEHFREFFIWVFQINAFIYTAPLAVKLRDEPPLLWFMLVGLMAIFKSYPSIGDVGLYLAMLPLWSHLTKSMRNGFVVGCMFLCTTALAPVLWHLWIYAGSANANFYFAVTLAFSAAQIFLVTDLLFAYLRWRYELAHGIKQFDEDGKKMNVILK